MVAAMRAAQRVSRFMVFYLVEIVYVVFTGAKLLKKRETAKRFADYFKDVAGGRFL
jgi:hypothetical protein